MKKISLTIIACVASMAALAAIEPVRIYTGHEADNISFNSNVKCILPSEVCQSAESLPMKAESLPMKAEGEMVTLKCNLTGSAIYTPFRYFVYNADVSYTKNPGERFSIPKGKYDICGEFYTGNYDEPYFARVILEDVEISENQTFDLDVAQACNVIFMYTADDSGTRLTLHDELDDSAPYTMQSIMFYTIMTHQDYKVLSFGVGQAGFRAGDISAERAFGFRVNNVSDKYNFVQARLIRLKDGGIMYHCPAVKGCSQAYQEFENSAASVLTVKEEYELTPLSKNYNRLQDNYISQCMTLFKGKDLGGFSASFGGDECKLYAVDNTIDNPATICQPLVITGALDIQDVVLSFDENGNLSGKDQIQVGVYGCPMIFSNGSIRHVNPNNTSIENTSILYPAISFLHGHDAFAFAHESKIEKYNNNTPIIVSTLRDASLSNGGHMLNVKLNSIGRWGENRQSDMYQMGVTLLAGDGTELYRGTHHSLNDKILEATLNGNKEFKLVATNENIEVDGLPVISALELTWDMEQPDIVPPAMTMLQTKNRAGEIKTHFSEAADVVIEFTAGDFRWDSDYNGFADDGDIAVKAEICGEDGVFTEIPANEIAELYHMPAFGHFYRATLPETTTDGWKDLRVSIVDKCGNTHTQTLEKAIYLSEPGNVSYLSTEKTVAMKGDKLCVATPIFITVFDLSGRVVLHAHVQQSLDLSSRLSHGAYLIRNSNDAATIKYIRK